MNIVNEIQKSPRRGLFSYLPVRLFSPDIW